MDRSGHRFAGPAISYGARYIGADGNPAVVDDGFRKMAERIAAWHEDGTMSKELWGSVSGTTYVGANEQFANAQVVMYMSGSWQIGQFASTIGDAFDWEAVPNPCGDATCTGMPGGAGLVAVKYTQHPEEVARVMDYLASQDVLREFYERTLFIPAHVGISTAGLDFKSDDPRVKASLDVFNAEVGKLDPTARALNAYPWSRVIFGASISRLGQVVAGELTLDDALARIEEDVATQMAEAAR
jgi:alpha-1,4-digalacturonate transport system substrate-binding protein